jgi:predicted  nucleic acid-binding Zn-ribbon protein
MENELNNLQANIQNLKEENAKFETNIKRVKDENRDLGKSLEQEKERACQVDGLYQALKEEVVNMILYFL